MSTMPPEDLNVPEEDPDVPVESPDEETTHEASQLEALAGELVETVETHVVEGISRLARFGIRFRRGITLTLLLVILAVVVVAQTGRGQELALRTALDRLDGVLAAQPGCCGRMSLGSMPATLTGAFMASRRKGSPSSWLRTTSMKVVSLFSICPFIAALSASVRPLMVVAFTPVTPQASAIWAYSTPTLSSGPTKLSSYQRVVLRFSAPHW